MFARSAQHDASIVLYGLETDGDEVEANARIDSNDDHGNRAKRHEFVSKKLRLGIWTPPFGSAPNRATISSSSISSVRGDAARNPTEVGIASVRALYADSLPATPTNTVASETATVLSGQAAKFDTGYELVINPREPQYIKILTTVGQEYELHITATEQRARARGFLMELEDHGRPFLSEFVTGRERSGNRGGRPVSEFWKATGPAMGRRDRNTGRRPSTSRVPRRDYRTRRRRTPRAAYSDGTRSARASGAGVVSRPGNRQKLKF